MRSNIPELLESGLTPEGIPYKRLFDRASGTMMTAYDFEMWRKYEEEQERLLLFKSRTRHQIGRRGSTR